MAKRLNKSKKTNSQITKRCHWVPQSYLRGFATEPEKPKQIWRLDKNDGEPELKNIKKVAVRNHLYVLRNNDGLRDDSQELRLAKLENFFGGSQWKALQTGYVDLSNATLRKMVTLLATTMHYRTPSKFLEYKNQRESLLNWLDSFPTLPDRYSINGSSIEIDKSSWPEFRDADEEQIKAEWFELINRSSEFGEHLLNMRWSMIISEKPFFVTSDNPVEITHPTLEHRGIKDPDTSISFPISPTRVLYLDNKLDEENNGYYAPQSNVGSNLLACRNANEHWFSSRHPDEVCREIVEFGSKNGL